MRIFLGFPFLHSTTPASQSCIHNARSAVEANLEHPLQHSNRGFFFVDDKFAGFLEINVLLFLPPAAMPEAPPVFICCSICLLYSTAGFLSARNWTMALTSSSETKAPCNLAGFW